MKVEYSSTNSGGGWWLEDKDWKALEKAGWRVNWGGVYFCQSKWIEKPEGKPEPHADGGKCGGHRKFDSFKDVTEDDRWLGALAKSAEIDVDSVAEAIRSFEDVTGQTASDQGCNCCGAPHSFSWRGGYTSGEDTLDYLYPNEPTNLSKRELLDRLSKPIDPIGDE